jgi:hypothetical protein
MCKQSIQLIQELAKTVDVLAKTQIRFEEQSKSRDMLIDSKLKDGAESRVDLLQEMRKGFDSIHTKLDKQDDKINDNKSYIDKALGIIGVIALIGLAGIKSILAG